MQQAKQKYVSEKFHAAFNLLIWLFSSKKSDSPPQQLDQTKVEELTEALGITNQRDILSLFTDLVKMYNALSPEDQGLFFTVIQEEIESAKHQNTEHSEQAPLTAAPEGTEALYVEPTALYATPVTLTAQSIFLDEKQNLRSQEDISDILNRKLMNKKPHRDQSNRALLATPSSILQPFPNSAKEALSHYITVPGEPTYEDPNLLEVPSPGGSDEPVYEDPDNLGGADKAVTTNDNYEVPISLNPEYGPTQPNTSGDLPTYEVPNSDGVNVPIYDEPAFMASEPNREEPAYIAPNQLNKVNSNPAEGHNVYYDNNNPQSSKNDPTYANPTPVNEEEQDALKLRP